MGHEIRMHPVSVFNTNTGNDYADRSRNVARSHRGLRDVDGYEIFQTSDGLLEEV